MAKDNHLKFEEYKALETEIREFVELWILLRPQPSNKGTCVVGNGVSISVVPPKKRKSRRYLLCSNADFGVQTEVNQYRELCAELKKEFGDYFRYESGRMD